MRAQRDDEIARRNDVRNHLHDVRHAGDRKDEARKNEGRQKRRQQRKLERDLLLRRDARDDEPLRLCAHEEQGDGHAQQQPRATHGHIEQQPWRRAMIISADANDRTRYGIVLPTTYARGLTGAILHLLHRPALLLADDRQRRGDDGGDHRDIRDEPGHEEQGAAQLRVVPDARFQCTAASRRRRRSGQRIPPRRSSRRSPSPSSQCWRSRRR